MKILTIISGPKTGPLSMTFSIRQADWIESLGESVDRLFIHASPSPVKLWRNYLHVRSSINQLNPDVIHAHYGTTTAWIVAMSTRRPLVITFHGSDLNPSPGQSWWKGMVGRFLSQWAARRAQRIICVSDGLRDRLMCDKTKASVIPMGYDDQIFFPMSKEDARDKLGWKHDDPVVLFNEGSGRRVKRGDLARAAYVEAKKLVPKLQYVTISGELEMRMIPLYMNASDVLILTSDYEGSPTVIKEAMACGLPIVSVDVGDVHGRLTKVSPSRIVERDPVKIGEAICQLIAIGLRSNGATIAKNELSDAVIAQKVIEVLRAAIERK